MSDTEKKKYKGGQVSMYEPSHVKEIMASSFIRKAFEDVGCLGFCEKIQEADFHAKLTSLFATNFRNDKANIAGVEFTISANSIASTTLV